MGLAGYPCAAAGNAARVAVKAQQDITMRNTWASSVFRLNLSQWAAPDRLNYRPFAHGKASMNHPASPIPSLTDKLVARKEGAIGWVIFNNPERHNATSFEMWQSLPLVLDAYVRDPEVRVIILRGTGEKAFSAGADISQFKEKRSSGEAVKLYNDTADASSRALRECAKPTIAMIHGYCIGGGAAIAVGCDIRFASDAAKFGVPAAKLGLGYRFDGIKRLASIVGPAFTAEIFFTGRQFTAQEALDMGLV